MYIISYIISFLITIYLTNFSIINLNLLYSGIKEYKTIEILFLIISIMMIIRTINLIFIGFFKKLILEKTQIILKILTNINVIILTFFLLKINNGESNTIYYLLYFFSGLFFIYNILIFIKLLKKKKSKLKINNIYLIITIISSILMGYGYYYLEKKVGVKEIYPKNYFKENIIIKSDNIISLFENKLDYAQYLEKYDLNSDYFLLANNLTKVDVLYLNKNFDSSKNIIENIDKNQKYNLDELKEISQLNLILANYYIKSGELETAKEVYIQTIDNLEYIINNLEGGVNFSDTFIFYSKLIINIINDLEANNKIFKIKDLRLILNSIPDIDVQKYFSYIVKNDLRTDEKFNNYKNTFNIPFLYYRDDFYNRVYNYAYSVIEKNSEFDYFQMDKLFLNYITNFEAIKNCKNYSSYYKEINNLKEKITEIKKAYN